LRLATVRGRGIADENALKKFAALGALLALLLVKQAAKFFGPDSFDTKTHATEDDVRRVILDYVEGRISLDELDTWLTQRTWDDLNAPVLAHRAELLIAEAERGDRADLAKELATLAQRTARYSGGDGHDAAEAEERTTAEPGRPQR
jgi:hypothetical protein